jgi:hypothetical protein
MGGLVGGLFDLFSGNPAGKEQDQFGGLAGYQTGVGEGLTTAGAGTEESILSGDPSKIAQVEAPAISAQQGQIQGQELQNANFGNRSGGTNASTQAAQGQGRANLIDLTGGLIGNTAGAAVGQGTGLMGQASSNLGNEAQLATQRRQQEVGDIGGIASSLGAIASPFLGGGAPGTAPGPVPWAPPNYLQQTGDAMPLSSDDQLGTDPFGWIQ